MEFRKRLWMSAAAITAALLLLFLFSPKALRFLLSAFLQERPPIIVKGGSIHFESVDRKDPKGNVKAHKRTWKGNKQNGYGQDQMFGDSVSTYDVRERHDRCLVRQR